MHAPSQIALNDGRDMPQLGFGVYQVAAGATAATVRTALGTGYRLIDTATAYGNEAGVGEGIRTSGLPRDAVFVTTKLWNDDQGYDAALRAFDGSLTRLGLEAVDLYLIHWPAPRQGLAVESWKALVRLRAEGRARSIGVSNFRETDLRAVIDATGVTPAVNQIELHPRFQQAALRALHGELGVATQAWSPLGRGGLLSDPALGRIAARHGRSPAQVVLRWARQLNVSAIPKSAHPDRIAENFAIDDFALTPEEMEAIAALDSRSGRTGPDPDTFPA